MMALIEQLEQLAQQTASFNQSIKYQHLIAQLKATDKPPYRASNPDVQLSASALVFKNQQLLMVKHPYLKQWLLPAGHVESDERPLQTVRRELLEETGIIGNQFQLVDANWIHIPENPIKRERAHNHLDLRYQVLTNQAGRQLNELPIQWRQYRSVPTEFQPYFELIKK